MQNPFDDPDTLRDEVIVHWQEHLPEMVAEYEAEGGLEALEEAVDQAIAECRNAVNRAIAEGLDFWTAWQNNRHVYLFLQSESELRTAEDGYTAEDDDPEVWGYDDDEDKDDEAEEDDEEGPNFMRKATHG